MAIIKTTDGRRARRDTERRGTAAGWLTLCALLWIAQVSVTTLSAGENGFVAGIDGLPLMPGLVEQADAGVVFDTPGGRIVEALTTGAADRASVLKFYDQTLPQLGWQTIKSGQYRREGEILTLEFPGGAPASVRFRLSPEG